ncbi:hypothetical protein M2366_003786 [Aeromonas sp. BIGb0405]|jgi:hypothetical protein|nr:hypothetical protein [Aeromonas sp. BIGb0405]MCS3461845.1 hypothetical protein [Aeromonas sp. BIGb0445]
MSGSSATYWFTPSLYTQGFSYPNAFVNRR